MNLPSVLVTEKKGWLKTPTQALIQGWTSHLVWKIASSLSNCVVASLRVPGIAWLNALLTLGSVWTLCRMPSELRILYGWPTWIPITCGLYKQPF